MIKRSSYKEIAKLPFYARGILFAVGLFVVTMLIYIAWQIIVVSFL